MVLPSTKTVGAQAKNLPLSHLYIYSSNNPCLTEDPWICLLVSTFTTLIQPKKSLQTSLSSSLLSFSDQFSGASLVAPTVKKLQCRRPGSIPGSGRSLGEGNGNPLQYSCLENSMDRGTWLATVHGVARVGHDLVAKPPISSLRSSHSYS